MTRTVTKSLLIGAVVVLAASAGAHTKPVWREAFQASPAAYAPPAEELIKATAERLKMSPEAIKAVMLPQSVSGTVRYRVTVQASGPQIRVRLSNEEGKDPLRLDAASVGLAADAFSARPGTLRTLTFGRAASVTIPAGAPLVSDPVDLPVRPGTELVVSAALASPLLNDPRGSAGFTVAPGNQALHDTLDQAKPMTGRPLVSAVSVLSEPTQRVIVAFGDSITDGSRSALDALHGWPEELARRLVARRGGGVYAVVNAGIGGNRILASGWGSAALARLDRDALRIDGVSHLILLEGINDIGMSGKGVFGDNPEITAEELIIGYRQIIARAHARGIKVYVGTLTPSTGAASHSSQAKDAIREAVNRWIRSSGEPDAVIDFEAMVRDPSAPTRLRPQFDSGDHLHPSDLGYKAMGDGINLGLFP